MTDPGPLSPEQMDQVATARVALRTMLRPARVARINAWTIAIFAGLTIAWGLVLGGGLVVGAALAGVAWNEFRGARMLRALDAEGGRVLGWNQLILAGVVVAYCVATILRSAAAADPSLLELETLAGLAPGTVAELTTALYVAVAVLVAIVQVVLARWHFGAARRIDAFRSATPPWILDLVRG